MGLSVRHVQCMHWGVPGHTSPMPSRNMADCKLVVKNAQKSCVAINAVVHRVLEKSQVADNVAGVNCDGTGAMLYPKKSRH